METSEDEAVKVEDEEELAEERARVFPREDNEWACSNARIFHGSLRAYMM